MAKDYRYLLIKANDKIDYDFLLDYLKGIFGRNIKSELYEETYRITHSFNDDLDLTEAINSIETDLLCDLKVFNSNCFSNLNDLENNFLKTLPLFNKIENNHGIYNQKLLIEELILNKMSYLIDLDYVLGQYANDLEMSNIINVFLKNNLNLSMSAKNLYMHRNTLMMKLDKFNKVTGYDLKKFEDAVILFYCLKLNK